MKAFLLYLRDEIGILNILVASAFLIIVSHCHK
jgi:hypothetical protein